MSAHQTTLSENLFPFSLSIFLHVIFLLILRVPNPDSLTPHVFEVSIVPNFAQEKVAPPQTQIVSPSEQTVEKPPLETHQRSEKDSTVEKEQIKRGSEFSGPVKGNNKEPVAPQTGSRVLTRGDKIQKNTSTALKTLSLDSATILSKFSEQPPQEKNKSSLGSHRPFSRPSGSGAQFVGLNGNADFLPNLPDGDVTLLNAKADKFAVFVRRVALQVFAQIRQQGWEFLSAGDIRSINNYTTITAIMNPQGKLIRVILDTSSGSGRFDQIISQAVEQGTKDPNPPKEAVASDGNYHFIFKSKSWSRVGNEPRHGFPREYRWLLLATGLE